MRGTKGTIHEVKWEEESDNHGRREECARKIGGQMMIANGGEKRGREKERG